MTENITFEQLPAMVSKALTQLNYLTDAVDKLNNKSNDGDSLYDLQGLCDYLKRKPGAIYDRVCKRTIPFIKKGGRLFFRKAEIDAWLMSGRHLSADDLSQ